MAECKAQNQEPLLSLLPDPMSRPYGMTFRIATRDFPPFNADRTKCVDQISGKEAFGHVSCDKGGITYIFVEVELKAELQKQCRAILQPAEIQFQWILPATALKSASSPVAMVCNGSFTSPIPSLMGKMCKSTVKTEAGYHRGKTSTADVASSCTSVDDTGCKVLGPDMAAGPCSIQIRIDCMALVKSTAQFLSTPQQVATRPYIETPFFGDILDKPFFGPFSLGLWIAIVFKTHTHGWDWSDLLRIVVVDGVWGMAYVLHGQQHERSVQRREKVPGAAEDDTEKGRERACGEAKDANKHCYGVFVAPHGLLVMDAMQKGGFQRRGRLAEPALLIDQDMGNRVSSAAAAADSDV
jgi:hypothetical protein